MTRAGMILGTAAYMAPEQARGRVVDSRADVWAFGCVLFEMLTGHQAFDGEDITAVLAKVIEREPDWTRVPARTPSLVIRLLHRALQKDRAKRLQHMGDARLDLDEALSMPGNESTSHAAATISPTSKSRRALAFAATLAVGVALGVVASGYWPRTSAPGPRALQFDIPVVGAAASRFTLSPDGRYLAYFAPGSGGFDVWLRDLSRASAERLIENVESVSWLAWSGDARSMMAGVTGGLRRFDVETGASLLQRGSWPINGQRIWLSEGRFLAGFGVASGPLVVESAAGRERTLDLDATVQESRQIFPAVVDDAGTFSYRSDRQDGSRYVCITRLDTGSPRCAGPVNHDSSAWYFNGSLIYARGGTLIARAFDIENVRLTGEEQSLADGLGSQALGIMTMTAASRADTLAFSVGAGGQRLVWRDRSGGETAIRPVASTNNLALSPDGRKVLVREGEALVMLDLATGGSSRLGPSLGDAIWSPDGHRLAHRTATGLVTRSVDSTEERVILDFKNAGVEAYTEDWSPDGQWLAVGLRSSDYTAALIPVGGGEPVRFLKNNDGIEGADEFHFSPSGKWIAFNAVSGGRSEVFVVANPPTAQRWQVSTRGGVQARWRPSSNTLHYLEQDGTMMEVAVQPGAPFSVGERKALFKVGFIPAPNFDDYRVAPDGRFLVKAPVGSEAIRVIVNWSALLKSQ